MENVTILDHPLIKHKISMLRDKNTGTMFFRILVEEISMLMGYEALRDLPTELAEVEKREEFFLLQDFEQFVVLCFHR